VQRVFRTTGTLLTRSAGRVEFRRRSPNSRGVWWIAGGENAGGGSEILGWNAQDGSPQCGLAPQRESASRSFRRSRPCRRPSRPFRVREKAVHSAHGTKDVLAYVHGPGSWGRFRSAAMVGTGRNDPSFYLELVGGLSQRLVLEFGLVRDLLHGCSSSIGTAKTDRLAVDLAPTALSAWRSFRCTGAASCHSPITLAPHRTVNLTLPAVRAPY